MESSPPPGPPGPPGPPAPPSPLPDDPLTSSDDPMPLEEIPLSDLIISNKEKKSSSTILEKFKKLSSKKAAAARACAPSAENDNNEICKSGRETPPIGPPAAANGKSRRKIRRLKRTLGNWFSSSSRGWRRRRNDENSSSSWLCDNNPLGSSSLNNGTTPQRALPPLPPNGTPLQELPPITFGIMDDEVPPVPGTAFFPEEVQFEPNENSSASSSPIDITETLEKVKDCGWYWGPISGEVAQRLLETEPDGSFVVRDSSSYDYIFSLTVKLNGVVRHVRIEHGKGNFSFGSYTQFKSNTIVEFIENAVAHSRSGRYLFFLHRRPELGPIRVQLLHPVSRSKRVQSLQHLSRFIILKHISRDQIHELPVPKRIREYLDTPFYYSEAIDENFATTPAAE